MKVLQKILFTFAIVLGLSLAVSAQKEKKPPKEKPPVITPAPTKPPPKKDDKSKKSSTEFVLAAKESLDILA